MAGEGGTTSSGVTPGGPSPRGGVGKPGAGAPLPSGEAAGLLARTGDAKAADTGAISRLRAWAAARAESDLISRLEDEPWQFDFFTLMRRMESMHADRPRLGWSQRPSEDATRLCQEPSLAFSPCTVARYRSPRGNSPPRLFVNFLGLLGPNGPLPLHLTEHARHRERHHRDSTFSRFMDVFNHRMVCFFYRAWVINNQSASFDRAWPGAAGGKGWAVRVPVDRGPEMGALDRVTEPEGAARDRFGWDDRYATYVGSLFGIGMESLRERDAVSDVSKLHFAGRLGSPTRCSEGLEEILGAYFKVPTRVEEFVGRWMPIPVESRLELGRTRLTGSLGETAVIGSRVWDCSTGFRIVMGPMGLADYERLLPIEAPGGASFRRLKAWVRQYAGDAYFWDTQLILRATDVPKTVLGKGQRLGWTTWLRGQEVARDRGDLYLRSCRDM